MKVFPTCLFSPGDVQADLERRALAGGVSISGDEDVVATDGGGRVFFQISNVAIFDRVPALAWRAIDAYLDGGARAIIVPLCDARHQPVSGSVSVTHSDGTPFGDESEYSQGDASAQIAIDADLRATTLYLENLVTGKDLMGGEWLSIDHPTMRWRAYRIAEIIDFDALASTATISIRPPLREAVVAGDDVDLSNPRCTMRLDGNMHSPMSFGYAAGSARFVEDFTGDY